MSFTIIVMLCFEKLINYSWTFGQHYMAKCMHVNFEKILGTSGVRCGQVGEG